jgi:hypothetical protein
MLLTQLTQNIPQPNTGFLPLPAPPNTEFLRFLARPQNFLSYLTRSEESQECFTAQVCIGRTMNSSRLGRRRISCGYGAVLT